MAITLKKYHLIGTAAYEPDHDEGYFDTIEEAQQAALDDYGIAFDSWSWEDYRETSLVYRDFYDWDIYPVYFSVNPSNLEGAVLVDIERLCKDAAHKPENWEKLSADYRQQIMDEVKKRITGFLFGIDHNALMVAYHGIAASGELAEDALLDEDAEWEGDDDGFSE